MKPKEELAQTVIRWGSDVVFSSTEISMFPTRYADRTCRALAAEQLASVVCDGAGQPGAYDCCAQVKGGPWLCTIA